MRRLVPIDHRIPAVAQRIHTIRMAAYRQEAELLGVTDFAPLAQTVDDVLASTDTFVGAFEDEVLAGVISVGDDEEGRGLNISSLVVHPARQRRGIGRSLLDAVIASHIDSELTVQTAAANAPALALYRQVGFEAYRHWFVGREPLELVKLSRRAARRIIPA